MTSRPTVGRTLFLAIALSAAASASTLAATSPRAATPPPSAPPPAAPAETVFGPPIPGVCILDGIKAMRASSAGVGAFQQLTQFAQAAQTELNGVSEAITKDDKALAAQKATLPPADYDKKAAAIRARRAALDRETRARNAQLEQTRLLASTRLAQLVNQAADQVVTARRCSLLLDRKSILGAASGMDITDATVQQLNASVPSLTISLAPRTAPAAAPAH